jgi:hypothetical protein
MATDDKETEDLVRLLEENLYYMQRGIERRNYEFLLYEAEEARNRAHALVEMGWRKRRDALAE